jgi:antitoxin PrlF
VKKQAKITSKGQITVPRAVREVLGVRAGDQVAFESDENGMRIRAVRTESRFSKYRGIGNPDIPSSRSGIVRWLRELRGQ